MAESSFQRINTLLPADATGAFVAIQAAINQFQSNAPFFTASLTIIAILTIAIFLPFYVRSVLNVDNRRRIFYLVATFVIWSLSITSEAHFDNLFEYAGNALDIGGWPAYKEYFVLVLRVLVLFWTFLVLPIAATSTPETQGGNT